MPEPPSGDGPFGLSGEGVLQSLVEQAGLDVLESGEVDLPFVYEDTELFWRGVISGGPPQAAKDIVGEDVLKEAVLEAIAPYMTDTGGIRLNNNAFQYVTATSGS